MVEPKGVSNLILQNKKAEVLFGFFVYKKCFYIESLDTLF